MTEKEKKSVFLFFGEDTYSSSQKLKVWKEGFIKKYNDISSVETFDNTSFDMATFSTNIETMPFLSEKRLLIFKDIISKTRGRNAEITAEESKKMAKILEKTPDFCVIIFHENGPIEKTNPILKKIEQIGTVEEFNLPSTRQIIDWILEKAKKKGAKISAFTAEHLANYCANNLWTTSNELEKLGSYADNREIQKEDIEALVIPALSSSIFKLTDKIAEKKAKDALDTFEILLESGEEMTRIFYMIVRHFRILIQIDDMLKRREPNISIIKRLKQAPFVVQKAVNQLKNFKTEDLKKIFAKMLEIDTGFKTGIIKTYAGDQRSYKLAIEKLIINLCGK
ncbi:DNA polymerase III subunit delta [Candidatus Peregrinibacteria bacterium]|nr:DNA polymerase III subunit delta [Candidatus Peregrinibacteria bacterium]